MTCDQNCESYYVKDVLMMTNICKAALVLFGDSVQSESLHFNGHNKKMQLWSLL